MSIGSKQAERIATRITEMVAALEYDDVILDVVRSVALGLVLALTDDVVAGMVAGSRGPLKTFGQDVKLTEDEYQKLCSQYGEVAVYKRIMDLDGYIGNRVGKTHYKNHYKTLVNWLRRDGLKPRADEAKVCPECGEKAMYAGYCRHCGYQL